MNLIQYILNSMYSLNKAHEGVFLQTFFSEKRDIQSQFVD